MLLSKTVRLGDPSIYVNQVYMRPDNYVSLYLKCYINILYFANWKNATEK